ncbi:MAG: hypothetical protein AAFV72_20495 [Cyanobacteria bacterium J06635_1]
MTPMSWLRSPKPFSQRPVNATQRLNASSRPSMPNPPEHLDAALVVTISVFKTQAPNAFKPLKAFLSFLENPKDIEQTLLQATCDCALNAETTFNWIVQNRLALKPDLDLDQYIRKLVLNKLIDQGFALGQDFRFELKTQLWLTPKACASLLQLCNPAEIKLITNLLALKTA